MNLFFLIVGKTTATNRYKIQQQQQKKFLNKHNSRTAEVNFFYISHFKVFFCIFS